MKLISSLLITIIKIQDSLINFYKIFPRRQKCLDCGLLREPKVGGPFSHAPAAVPPQRQLRPSQITRVAMATPSLSPFNHLFPLIFSHFLFLCYLARKGCSPWRWLRIRFWVMEDAAFISFNLKKKVFELKFN